MAAVAAAFAGCGESGDERDASEYPATVEGARSCLAAERRFSEVETAEPGHVDSAALSPRERRAIVRATGEADAALAARSGGPVERDGVIVEAPVRSMLLYFFADAAAAERAESRLHPVVGEPSEAVLGGVSAVGRVLVVHYSFGIGDRPGGVPLDAAALEPIERCLRATGHA